MHLAIIEDNASDFFTYTRALSEHSLTRFETLEQFLKSSEKFDGIIVDLMLPDAWGQEVIDAMAGQNFVVVSGLGDGHLRGTSISTMIEDGAKEVFSKDWLHDRNFETFEKELVAALEQK